MTTNAEVATLLQGIADLLELQGVRFKPEAYRRAARSIESLPEDLRVIAGRGGLDEIPAVGEAIAEKIREFLAEGRIPYHDRLRAETPEGLLALVRLPGVGPKTARRFQIEFGIAGPTELRAALDEGRFHGVKGFGDRKIAALRSALDEAPAPSERTGLLAAWRIAGALVDQLRRAAPIDRIEVAGSLRRRRESVGDLDILVTSVEPERVFDAFGALPDVTTVRLRGPTKSTVVVRGGLQVDLRVVEPAAFGAALQYFTGSKDHNVALRTRARDRGLKVNEYGVYRGDERVAGATEEQVYTALGLGWIPPEIRENDGEIEAAAERRLPDLVDRAEAHGDAHVHLEEGATPASIDARLGEAAAAGLRWIGVVVPDPEPAWADHLERRVAPGEGRAAALRVWEGAFGSRARRVGPFEIVDARAGPVPEAPAPPGEGRCEIVGHLMDLPSPAERTTWIEWAGRSGYAIEVGPDPGRSTLDPAAVRGLGRIGSPIHVTAAITRPTDRFDAFEVAIGVARRGWIRADALINRMDPGAPGPRGRTAAVGSGPTVRKR